jgi:hypothetical protein
VSGVEYDYEPIPGLPGNLPEGEVLLWQGRPRAWPLARRALRVPWVGSYFGLLAAWQLGNAYAAHQAARVLLRAAGMPLLLGALVLLLLATLAWAAARATVYSITSQRVVIRHGIALPMSLNLPFKQINGAALRSHRDGSGELALKLAKEQRVGYLLNWPHVRPGHYAQPQPTLRAIDDAPRVAELLAAALTASSRSAATSAAPAIIRVAPTAPPAGARSPVAA